MSKDAPVPTGLVHVYTGDGKGKTTCAFGLAMRAAGRGCRVLVIQFMKPQGGYGEQVSAQGLGIEVRPRGRKGWVDLAQPGPDDIQMAPKAMDEAADEMASQDWNMVVLDELAAAIAALMITEDAVKNALTARNPVVEVVITGRRAPGWLLELADYVTEMKQLKHPFQKGTDARAGIEF